MRNGFGMRFFLSVIAVAVTGIVTPGLASAGWSPIEPTPGFSGSRPYDLTQLDASDGSRFLYWTRDVGGFGTVQGRWIAANGTPGAEMNISNPAADFGHDLQGVIAADNEVTISWIGPGVPNEMVRSVNIGPGAGSAGPVVDISPVGAVNQGVEQLSTAVTPNGTVGYTWRRLFGVLWRTQVVTVPDAGPVGTARFYSTFPDTVVSPVIAAMPDNRFKLAWVLRDIQTNFWNIPSLDLENGGAPVGEPVYLFPRTVGALNPDGTPMIDPGTGEQVQDPSGATGDPGNLNMGTDTEGSGFMVWRQFTIRTELIDGLLQVVGTQWSAEEARFSTGVPPAIGTPLSADNTNISEIHLNMEPEGRHTATWLAERDGNFTTQLFRFAGRGIWNITSGPVFSDPTVSEASDRSALVGWTEEGPLPGQSEAKVAQIRPNGSFVLQDLPVGGLKASAEPLPQSGVQGLDSVTFYGLDLSDVGSFYRTSFTDPGISMQPPNVFFGTGLLNIDNGERRAYVFNPGTTPTQVNSVGLSGTGQDSFSIVNPGTTGSGGCVGALPPGGICEIRVTFSPDAVGQRQAALNVSSDAGNVSSQLEGRAVARTRLRLNVRPKRRAVKPGRTTRFTAVVANRGGITAKPVRLCYAGSRKVLGPRKKCVRINNLAAGKSRRVNFRIRLKGRARQGREYRVMFRIRSNNANSSRRPVIIKAR